MVETKPFHKGVYEKLLGRTACKKRKEDEVYQCRLEERSCLVELGMNRAQRAKRTKHSEPSEPSTASEANRAQRMPEDANEPYPGTLRCALADCIAKELQSSVKSTWSMGGLPEGKKKHIFSICMLHLP